MPVRQRLIFGSGKIPAVLTGVALLAFACVQNAQTQGDGRVDQADVESLVWRIAWGAQSQSNAEAFLGQDLITPEFYRVKSSGESGLAQLAPVAPGIDEDELRRVNLSYMHVAVFGLSAIATASVTDSDGEDQTFAIMCVETSDGWKIAALLAS